MLVSNMDFMVLGLAVLNLHFDVYSSGLVFQHHVAEFCVQVRVFVV